MFVQKSKSKILRFIFSVLVLLVFITSGTITSIAAHASEATSNADSTSASSSSSSSSEPINATGGLTITSYSTHVAGQTVTQITPGMAVSLEVRIHDSRITPQTNASNFEILPRGKMNTTSFRPTDAGSVTTGRNGQYVQDGYDYVLEFVMIYNGEGNTFQADVYYEGLLGDIAPLQTITLTLNNTIPTPSSSSSISSSSSEVVRGTGFALKDASYGDTAVMAGEEFMLSMTMLATNGANNIENVSATIVPDQHISLASGVSTIYFGTAAPNQSIPLEFNLLAAANTEDGSYKVTVNLAGVSALTGEQVTTSVDISIPISQPDRLVINNFAPPDYITAATDDGAGYMSVELINMGKSKLSNVIVTVVSDDLYTLDGQSYVGTFEAGAKNGVDITIMSDIPGEYEAELIVSYENARGEVNELTETFTVTVGEAFFEDDSIMIDPIEEETTTPAWVVLLIAAIALLAVGSVVFIIVKKKRKKAKDAELEDDDDEDL